MELTDRELVNMARAGNRDAFGLLTQRHWKHCVRVAWLYVRNDGEAEDQSQNAILKAYKRLDQYKGDAEFSTWLGRIVANECLMLMRRQRRSRFVYLDENPSDFKRVPVQLPAIDPDPEGALAHTELSQTLRSEMRRIPSLMRHPLVLRDLHGLSMDSVAEQLGISVSAAKSRLVRARVELRSRMRRHCDGVGNVSALSRTAAPLSKVGRRCKEQAA
jgi:RNA polymerase sigma-70 factor (ECF subfamily)